MFRDEWGLSPIDKLVVLLLALANHWHLINDRQLDKLLYKYNEWSKK